MSDIVNLNKARKAKARVAAKVTASENRARFGVSRADRTAIERERQALARAVDGAKLERE
jgi:predicted secreted protein